MLTLITVNYNNAQGTIGLLRSLQNQTDPEFDIIVVDNDSTPDDRALLGGYAGSSPLNLDVIYSETNRGFAGGNNLAIRKALAQPAEWFVLINNDTTVGPDFIASLRGKLPAEGALVGIPLSDGERTAYAGRISWLRPTLSHADEFGQGKDRVLTPALQAAGYTYQSSLYATAKAGTPILCAACHASNALGTPGIAPATQLTTAMQGFIANPCCDRPAAENSVFHQRVPLIEWQHVEKTHVVILESAEVHKRCGLGVICCPAGFDLPAMEGQF